MPNTSFLTTNNDVTPQNELNIKLLQEEVPLNEDMIETSGGGLSSKLLIRNAKYM